MADNPKYFVYRTKFYSVGGGLLQAKLISDPPNLDSPQQHVPYGSDITLTYQIDPKFNAPDNYLDTNGFKLYSEKLLDIMKDFEIKHESFPVKMVDKNGKQLKDHKYYVFHSLEGVIDGIDEQASNYRNDIHDPFDKLVLDYSKFKHRPTILLDKVYIPIMREDLKEELDDKDITGFRFLEIEKYILNDSGFPPEFPE